jgi:hypothetical protein
MLPIGQVLVVDVLCETHRRRVLPFPARARCIVTPGCRPARPRDAPAASVMASPMHRTLLGVTRR